MVMNFHLEPARSRGDDPADATHAEDAEALAGNLPADHEGGAPVFPLAVTHQTLALAGAPRRAEHQQQRDFGGRVR